MLPKIFSRKKSSGIQSPGFLEWRAKKRARRKKIRATLKKIRNNFFIKNAFKKLKENNSIIKIDYSRLKSKRWKKIIKRFKNIGDDEPPLSIEMWFCEF